MRSLQRKKQRLRRKLKDKNLRLIIGVGNPGEQYENTRQNMGFFVVDKLSAIHKIDIDIKKKKSIIGIGKIGKEKVCLLRPMTFANITGEAALYIASYLRVRGQQIICIYDDSSLEFGKIRIGLDNPKIGHIGLESMVTILKNDDFIRVGVGIGKVPSKMEREDFILTEFKPRELRNIEEVSTKASQAVKSVVTESLEKAINDFSI